ncbi:hypothetical protein LLH00_05885 [bacterium]|nr:hypothetical protein [bacterium]
MMSSKTAVMKQPEATELQAQPVFACSVEQIETQIAEMNKFVERCLVASKEGEADGDFGVIPGCGDKPTLLQPGADKLCRLFGIYPDFEILSETTTDGFIRYVVKCALQNRNGEFMGSGIGSCNSAESKYRKTLNKVDTVVDWEATEEQKRTGQRVEKTSKKGKTYIAWEVPITLPAWELDNTILKMARKRAYVAAVISATRLHHRFTQDIEDMDRSTVGRRERPQEVPAEVVNENSQGDAADIRCNDLKSSLQECRSVEEVNEWKAQYGASIKSLPEYLQKEFFEFANNFKATLPEKTVRK